MSQWLNPISERPAPYVCDHHAMPGRCLAPACRNYDPTPAKAAENKLENSTKQHESKAKCLKV